MKRIREKEKNREELQKQKTINKMPINTYLLVKTLNVDGLNSPLKRYSVAEWIKKDPSVCYLQETHFRCKDTHSESEGMGKAIPCKWKPKESWSSYPETKERKDCSKTQ